MSDTPQQNAQVPRSRGRSPARVCYHEHLGMGPVRYLGLRRTHLARAALIRADPASASVTLP
jgi:hypothetical protein